MKDDKIQPTSQTGAAPAATSEAQRPADSELRFSHLIRNMIAARDEERRARKT